MNLLNLIIFILLIIISIISAFIIITEISFFIENINIKGGSKANIPLNYYVFKSEHDDQFVNKVQNIINNSEINNRLNFVNDINKANIVLQLLTDIEIIKLKGGYDEEYYPGTKKKIKFSFTYYKTVPIEIYINYDNWESCPESGLSVQEYQQYVILHEMMHALGYDHVECNNKTSTNGICPIMYQSTRGPPNGFKTGNQITSVDYTKLI
jgi:hypothetical protein